MNRLIRKKGGLNRLIKEFVQKDPNIFFNPRTGFITCYHCGTEERLKRATAEIHKDQLKIFFNCHSQDRCKKKA